MKIELPMKIALPRSHRRRGKAMWHPSALDTSLSRNRRGELGHSSTSLHCREVRTAQPRVVAV